MQCDNLANWSSPTSPLPLIPQWPRKKRSFLAMFLWVYFFVILGLAVYAYLVRYYRQILLATKLPGPKAYPLIGNYNTVRTNSGKCPLLLPLSSNQNTLPSFLQPSKSYQEVPRSTDPWADSGWVLSLYSWWCDQMTSRRSFRHGCTSTRVPCTTSWRATWATVLSWPTETPGTPNGRSSTRSST